MKVHFIPQFVDINSKSNNVSIFNERSHFLLRDPPRKWKAYDMEIDNALLATAQSKIEELEYKIRNQYVQLEKYEETQEFLFKNKENLCKLYELEYIDSDDEPKEENNKS